MAITRAEAIELAVRRHIGLTRQTPQELHDDVFYIRRFTSPSVMRPVEAIRAHFRVICRTYGVVPMTSEDIIHQAFAKVSYDTHAWPQSQPSPLIYDPPEYDGHSLRI